MILPVIIIIRNKEIVNTKNISSKTFVKIINNWFILNKIIYSWKNVRHAIHETFVSKMIILFLHNHNSAKTYILASFLLAQWT